MSRTSTLESLKSADWRAIHAILPEIYALADVSGFPQAVARLMPRIIPLDQCGTASVDYGTGSFSALREPAIDAAAQEKLNHLFISNNSDHPLASAPLQVLSGTTVGLASSLGRRRFRSGALFNEFYRSVGVHDELGVALPVQGKSALCFFGWRTGQDFSALESARVEALRPHLQQAYRNAQSATRLLGGAALLDDLDEGMPVGFAWVEADGRVRHWSERARALAQRYFPREPASARRLPETLARWVRRSLSEGRATAGVPARECLHAELPESRLTVRLLNRRLSPDVLLTLEERSFAPPEPERLQFAGLTPREAQILWWIAQGKTNPEIATILAANPQTVKKHVENIRAKLGVETRTAAVMRASEAWAGMV